MQLTKLKNILDEVAPSYYLSYSPKDVEEIKTPIIVFSKINSTFKEFSDDLASIRTTLYQINLITSDVKEADVLAMKLEEIFIANDLPFTLTSEYLNQNIANDLPFTLTSEYLNQNNTISTIYEIKMEEFKYVE